MLFCSTAGTSRAEELLDYLLLGRDTDDPEASADRHIVQTGILEGKVSRKQATVTFESGACFVLAVCRRATAAAAAAANPTSVN